MSVDKIGRYKIVGELGRGAMGVVYKATDPNIGRTVALKTMRVDVHGLESADLMRRFKNEARAAGLLSHPNIVTIYDAGEYDGIFYIAMECLEGTTLQELMAERRLETGEAVRIAHEIAKGLDYAHSHGIVHRDVKPANIMITRRGAVKIMDFGIAKAGGSMTATGQVLGSPNYMSPEQVKGKSFDGRSDLFSLGVLLYEMLTGEKPFAGQNVTTIIYKIVNENPIPPRELETAVPAGLNTLVLKALAKSPIPPAKKRPARLKRASIGAALVVLLLGSIAGALAYYRAHAKLQVERAEIKKELQAPTPQPALTPNVPSPSPTPSPTVVVASATPEPSPETTPNPQQESWYKPKRRPPPPPPPPLSELTIASQPAGAKVSIDGRDDLNWVTPFRASRLSPGNHKLVFSRDGYAQESRSVESLAGKSVSLSVDLTPVFKAIITSNPSGANILVDGEDSGMVTPAQLTLEKRQHHITVHKSGYHDASTDASQTVTFSPILLSANQASESGPTTNALRRFLGTDSIPEGKGLIHVRTVPDGATIVVDGRVSSKKSNTRWPANPGIYTIELKLPGYKPVHRNIRVEVGKIGNVDEILERE